MRWKTSVLLSSVLWPPSVHRPALVYRTDSSHATVAFM